MNHQRSLVTLGASLALLLGTPAYAATAAAKPAAAAATGSLMSTTQAANLQAINTRLEALNWQKNAKEDAKALSQSQSALQYVADKRQVPAKQFNRDYDKLLKGLRATERKLLEQKYLNPIDNALSAKRNQKADDFAYYSYKKAKTLRKATAELIETKPQNVEEITRFSAAAMKEVGRAGSLSVDAKKITRIGERDAERFIAHVSWLFDQINQNAAEPVDLSGMSLDERAAAIIGKPLPLTPQQIHDAKIAKAKKDAADKKAAAKQAQERAKAELKAKQAAAKKANGGK